MKKRILIALALCMALGTACGKKEVEEGYCKRIFLYR